MDSFNEIIKKLNPSDYILIINTILNSAIGIWLVISVQKNFATNRAIKDYYIEEIKDLRKSYVDFLNNIYNANYSAKHIKDWLKIMTNRIDCLEKSIEVSFVFEGKKISKMHSEIQNYITRTDDYNEGYSEAKLEFKDTTKNEILIWHTKLLNCFTNSVVNINKASLHNFFCKLWQKIHNVFCMLWQKIQ